MADWQCTRCSAQNAPDATSCYFCGSERDPATVHAAPDSEVWSPDVAQAAQQRLGVGPGGLAGGLAVGALAAVAATLAWYLVVALSGYQLAFVAIVIGWLIGTAAVFGARGRVSWPLVGAAVAFTLVGLAVSEYLIIYHVATEMVRAEGLGGVELLQPLEFIVDVVISSLQEDPVTLLFWGLALAAAGWVTYRAMRDQQLPPASSEGPSRDA